MPRSLRRPLKALTASILVGAISFGVACSNKDEPDTERLSPKAVGAVTIGPAALPIPDGARTIVVTFDERGKDAGRLAGGPISSATTIGWPHGLTAVTAESVITLSEKGTDHVPIDENMVEGITSDSESGGVMVWFNTAQPDGPSVPYRNNYVMTSTDAATTTGSVNGTMLTAGHCGTGAYGVVADIEPIFEGQASTPHRLYYLPTNGQPTVRGETWNSPTDLRPFSRTSVCSTDGSAIYNLYGNVRALRDETGKSGLTLVRIDTATGARTETPVDLDGHKALTAANSLAFVGERLYWISSDGAVLSLPSDPNTEPDNRVREEWRVAQDDKHRITIVRGTTVSSVTYADTATYSEYDLLSGVQLGSDIELPWLRDTLKENNGSSVLSITPIPGKSR